MHYRRPSRPCLYAGIYSDEEGPQGHRNTLGFWGSASWCFCVSGCHLILCSSGPTNNPDDCHDLMQPIHNDPSPVICQGCSKACNVVEGGLGHHVLPFRCVCWIEFIQLVTIDLRSVRPTAAKRPSNMQVWGRCVELDV
jgi:hypothetical protein